MEKTMEFCLLPQVKRYITEVGRGDKPQHVYYFRDGVSEGQYKQVLDLEVKAIKNILQKEYSGWQVGVPSKKTYDVIHADSSQLAKICCHNLYKATPHPFLS